ncbi:DUF429 domain-containing protein [Halobacteriaceae archaeon GCM10025711]
MARNVGVDAYPEGWVAVARAEDGFDAATYRDVEDLWSAHADAERIFMDVPIGLRTDGATARDCDAAARQVLSPHQHGSVFPTPVRAALAADGYEEAREIQESRTDGSLSPFTWGIMDRIAELDAFLRTTPDARGVIRESHPEVCFWAVRGGSPVPYSKKQGGFWERVGVLAERTPATLTGIVRAGRSVTSTAVAPDDLVDAFVLAVAASAPADELRTLPDDPPVDDEGLPMEMVYWEPS